jgi:cyclopropane-fatty-acyl-phospholipid synthase
MQQGDNAMKAQMKTKMKSQKRPLWEALRNIFGQSLNLAKHMLSRRHRAMHQPEAAFRIVKRLLSSFPGAVGFYVMDQGALHFGVAASQFTLLIRDPAVLRRLVFERSPLPLVDGYIKGSIELDGDLYAALGLKQHFERFNFPFGERWMLLMDAWRLPAQLRIAPVSTTPPPPSQGSTSFSHSHTKESDSAAISFHYDVSNQFYQLWLDQKMVYSCAYFESPDDSLEQAQCNKLDHICRKLRLTPGERFLDVGCGWGALVCWAAQHYGVHAHGITISQRQYDYAKERIRATGLGDRVCVELRDYRDLEGQAVYDKVASVGMFEHVGLANLPLYNQTVNRVLRPGGLFLNHGITHEEEGWTPNVTTRFINRYVFPNGELDTVSNIQRGMEHAGFEIHDLEGLRPHYALTLRHWVQRLEARRDDALQYVNEETYRLWKFYLTACALTFENDGTGIYQILASRQGSATPAVPLTRRDIYQANELSISIVEHQNLG